MFLRLLITELWNFEKVDTFLWPTLYICICTSIKKSILVSEIALKIYEHLRAEQFL